MRLTDFAGNKEMKYELEESMKNHSLPHALIIEGAAGTGKKTLASFIASYAVCTAQNKPCGCCAGCLKAEKGIHPDITVADGTTLSNISVDAIRKIRADCYIKPNEAPNKVYILADCDKMLQPAQNAFLKVLEEPPENVIFIMTTASASSLLQTVRSRSRILTLFVPDSEEAAVFLTKSFPDKSPEEIKECVEAGGGNIGMAKIALEGKSEEARQLARNIIEAVSLSAEYELLRLTAQMCRDRAFASRVADCLMEFTAECIKASAGINTSPAAKAVAKKLSIRRLNVLFEKVRHAKAVLYTNVNLNFFGTWFCAALREK